MSKEHKCDDLQRRNIQYEHMIEIGPDIRGNWNIERVAGRYSKYERVLRDIKYCPFCGEGLQ